MIRYQMLLRILDELRMEAPETYKSYHPRASDEQGLIKARSQAFIHLYLKVRVGIGSFGERQELVTDGTQDGGLDAYYLDREYKKLYLIQSKFRATAGNFEEKSISADDLVKMEISRILKGEATDSNGKPFNEKIKAFQEVWRAVADHAHYEYVVIILGNLTKYNDEQIRRLIHASNYTVFDFGRTYEELVLPLCSGTCYDPNQIEITIDLGNKEQSTLRQRVSTRYGDFSVRVVFVPVGEIGRILSKYKNAILKYNPRNFLSLSGNKVNQSIKASIVDSNTNDFAILNNGITLICEAFQMSESTGNVDVGQIILSKPQIINGGQTAYTLSKVYDEYGDSAHEVFGDKEVLLKAIIIGDQGTISLAEFIGEISNATNQQSKVEEADRRSNEPMQIELQKHIFQGFGLLYERKLGEFHNGLALGYVRREDVIERTNFLRAYLALKGEPRWARQRGKEFLFRHNQFYRVFASSYDYPTMVFAYLTLMRLYELEKKGGDASWGYGLRYGKMAVIGAIGQVGVAEVPTRENVAEQIQESIGKVQPLWKKFESRAREKPENATYAGEDSKEFDYNNYYKGKTLDNDIRDFFGAGRAQST